MRSSRRRGTILIFTIGVLTLIVLVGVGVLANVRTQRARVQQVRTGVTPTKLIDGVQQAVLERLRSDLWGDPLSAPGYLTGSTSTAPSDSHESNEAFDAPGPYDRWLASTVPYLPRDATGAVVSPSNSADQTLNWYRVSYLGGDVVDNGAGAGANRFRWAINSRSGGAMPGTPIYSDSSLQNVAIRYTPPDYTLFVDPFIAASGFVVRPTFIPGSTTNVTIGDARLIWQQTPQGGGAAAFPYFDTNMDGEIDLYDADGDGVPDSPISFVLPYSGSRSDEPRSVYAVVRVVDNSSMLNLATAGARDSDGDGLNNGNNPTDLFYTTWNDLDRQLRGRRVWEICLDAPSTGGVGNLAPVLDADRGATIGQFYNYRATGNFMTAAMPGSNAVYPDVIRRLLVNGANRASDNYGRFRVTDELALRNRGGLRGYVGGGIGAQSTLSTALPNTLGSSGGPAWRWVRYNVANPYGPTQSTGWVAMLDTETVVNRAATYGADVPPLRRPLLTSVSRLCDRALPTTAAPITGLSSGGAAITVQPMPYGPGGTGTPEKIDLNTPVVESNATARAEYLGWLIWAINNAGSAASGLQVMSDPNASGTVTAVPRARLAAQLAANIMDFRDSDDTPTVIEDSSGASPVVGMERQPFINETYAHIKKTRQPDGSVQTERRYAVELINPYPVDMVGYRLKAGPNTAIVLPTVPAATGVPLVPGRVVITSDTWNNMQIVGLPATLPPDVQEGTGIELSDATSNTVYKLWLLRPDVVVAGAPVEWPCDTFSMQDAWATESNLLWFPTPDPGPNPGDTVEKWNCFQREELDSFNIPSNITWKFTVGRSKRNGDVDSATSHSLTEPNRETLGGTPISVPNAVPSIWTFRNYNLTPGDFAKRAFESPLELSRVLAFGNELDIANPTSTSEWLTVPELLAKVQAVPPPAGVNSVPAFRATAGRLDLANLASAAGAPPTGRLLHFLTCSGGQFDIDCMGGTCNPVDEDGNGTANDPGEYAAVGFRQAGLMNVNTAPALVLRAVPWMTRMDANPADSWDFAPAIVSMREKRPVQSTFGVTADYSNYFQAGKPFVTVADICHASSIDPHDALLNPVGTPPALQFDLARLAQAGVVPVDNAGSSLANDLSPDFDRDLDGAARASNELRARDLYLSRWGNILTTRSDVFTVYVALIDENGRYLRRSRFVVDRSNCAVEDLVNRRPILPTVMGRADSDYYDDTR